MENEEAFDTNLIPLFSSSLPKSYCLYLEGTSKKTIILSTRTRGLSLDTDREGFPMLFVDDIWPAAYLLSDYLKDHQEIVRGKNVIEFGAGAGLPSCVADLLGACKVLITDYPADGVIENIEHIISVNNLKSSKACGHIWGESVEDILLESTTGFDVILLADVLWKDTYNQHEQLIQSIISCLSHSCSSIVLIALCHRPTNCHTSSHDLEFFSKATRYNLKSELLLSSQDYGTDVNEEAPITVYLYSLQRI